MLRLYDSVKQFVGKSGVPLVGGRVYVYLNGTDDLASLYADPAGLTPIQNPMVLDSDGRTLGCYVDDGKAYRIEVNDASDALQWTVYPVSPLGGSGGGSSGHVTEITSSDGTVGITESTAGNRTVYDLSTDVKDSTDLLNWIRCDGADRIDGTDTWKPTYTAGTMVVGTRGIMLGADQYYHVTAHVRATKTSAAPYYDDIFLLYKLDDGTAVTPVTRQTIIVDCSMGLSQDFEFSTDVKADTDCELLLDIIGQEQAGISFEVLNVELHRIYSGAPHLPAGIGRSEQSDWTETDDLKMSYIRHKPDLSLYVTDSELETILEGYATTADLSTGLATKQDTISDLAAIRSGAQAGSTAVQPAALDSYATKVELNTGLSGKQDTIDDLSEIRSGAAAGSTALQPSDVATVATTGDYDDLSNRPTIPSGAQLVPAATSADADKVLTVDSQGVPGWAVIPLQPTGLFQATYGTSTYKEVRSAVAGNKIVYCYVNGRMAFLAFIGPNFYEFQYYRSNGSSSGTDLVFVYQVTSSGWTTTERTVKAGNIPVTRVDVNGSSAMVGTVAEITIPTKTSDITNDSGFITDADVPVQDVEVNGTSVVNAQGVAEITIDTGAFVAVYGTTTMAQVTAAYDAGKDIVCRYNDGHGRVYSGQLSSVAYGVYTFSTTDGFSEYDFTLSPNGGDGTWTISSKSIPSVDQSYNSASTNAQSGTAVAGALASYTPTASLSTVALTGDYDDLLDKPTIPVLPSTKDLVAGNNITITEGTDDVTVACDITVGTVTI